MLLFLVIASLFQVSCYETSVGKFDAMEDYLDLRESTEDAQIVPDEIISIDLREVPDMEGPEADGPADVCQFNENKIWIGYDPPDCEGEMSYDFSCDVFDIVDEQIECYSEYYGMVTIRMEGILKVQIEHSFQVGDILRYLTIEYFNETGRCIRGVALLKVIGGMDCYSIFLRDGDLNNPFYPEIQNNEFRRDLVPLIIESVSDECDFNGEFPPGCPVQQVFKLSLINLSNELALLSQGQTEIFYNGLEGAEKKSYIVTNNYSYRSDDCGGDHFGYYIQMNDPSYLCL
jgi:hypothetical protein